MKPVYPAPRALPSYENLLLEMVEPNILKVTPEPSQGLQRPVPRPG